jgi:hypothetical protein
MTITTALLAVIIPAAVIVALIVDLAVVVGWIRRRSR